MVETQYGTKYCSSNREFYNAHFLTSTHFFTSYSFSFIIHQDLQRFKLGNPRMFHYLNQSNCYELDGVDDSKEYIATRRAMDIVGISSDEQVFIIYYAKKFSHSSSKIL